MTSDDETFLAAICAHPADDVPRLVYADYLEEHDQPERAHFIRLQCELASLTEQHPDYYRLFREELAIRKQYESSWSIPGLRGVQHFHRGFVEVIQTSAEWLLDCPAEAFRLVPVRELRLVTMDRYVESIVELDFLDRIETLTLNNNSLGSRQRLDTFLRSRPLSRLQHLGLRNCMLWPDSIQVLVNSPQARQLISLDLSGNPVGDQGIEYMALSPMEQLQTLIIHGDELDARECLHGTAAELLADPTSHLKQLRYLDWGDQYISDTGLRALARSKNFTQVEKLRLFYNEIGSQDLQAIEQLLSSADWQSLVHLDLDGNIISESAAQAIADWVAENPKRLVELYECGFEPGADQLLASAPHRSQIKLNAEDA